MSRSFEIDLDYESYTTFRVNPDNVRDVFSNIESYPLERLVHIIDEINSLNLWHSPNVRKYTFEMLKNRGFYISDPTSEDRIKVGATYLFDDFQTIFFFFGQSCRIGIVSSDLAAGFPLSTIILFDKKIIIHLTESFWGFGERHFKSLADRGDNNIKERSADCEICLVTGDPNFAHHAWNELSSLQEIAEQNLDYMTSLVVAHEPFGPINDVLGSRFNVLRKLTRAQTPEVNHLDALTFCSSGIHIARRLVDKIINFADAHLSPCAVDLKRKLETRRARTLWVSVRTRNRTIDGQKNVLVKLIEEYLRGRSDRMVVIDGHSLPFDHDNDASYIQDINNAISYDDMKAADDIIAMVKDTLPDAEIAQFVGRPIHESIAVGRHAGFYFCHHGTVQHKVGWFSDIPGIVHCNRDVLQIRPAHWVQQQSEVAALPVYLPIDLIAQAGPNQDEDELHAHLHHEDYRIVDIEEVSRTINDFADHVEMRQTCRVFPII